MKKSILALFLTMLFCTSATAEPYWVVGYGAGMHQNEHDGKSVNPLNLFISLALSVNDYVEVGAEYSTTLVDDDFGSSDIDVDTNFVFLRGKMTLDSGTVLYAQVGRSSIELLERGDGFRIYADDAGTGFGFGARFKLRQNSAYNVEYVSYYDDDEFDGIDADTSHSSLNFGYLMYF